MFSDFRTMFVRRKKQSLHCIIISFWFKKRKTTQIELELNGSRQTCKGKSDFFFATFFRSGFGRPADFSRGLYRKRHNGGQAVKSRGRTSGAPGRGKIQPGLIWSDCGVRQESVNLSQNHTFDIKHRSNGGSSGKSRENNRPQAQNLRRVHATRRFGCAVLAFPLCVSGRRLAGGRPEAGHWGKFKWA